MPKPLRTSAGTWLKRSSGGYVRRAGDPVRTFKLQNSWLQGTGAAVNLADSVSSAFHDVRDAGNNILMRTKELIEDGYMGSNGELVSWPPGAVNIGAGGLYGTYYKDAESYYAGRVLVQEVMEGLFDMSVNIGMSTAPSWVVTLERYLNVTEAGDGVQTLFTVAATTGQAAGTTARQLRVYVDGARLAHGTDYTVADNGSNLDVSFASAPANGASIRIYSVRKEYTFNNPPSFHQNWTFNTSGSASAVVSNFKQVIYLKQWEDEIYAPEPYRRINPGYRTYLDHCDVVRCMDPFGRIMEHGMTSFAEHADKDSTAWAAEDISFANNAPWNVKGLSRKRGTPLDIMLDYCENGAPSGHKKILWYHFTSWLCSPVRQCMYTDQSTDINRGWFSTALMDISTLQIEAQASRGNVTISTTGGWFDYDPLTDGGNGLFYANEQRVSDGVTNPHVLAGQATRDYPLRVRLEKEVGKNEYDTLTEGVDYTMAVNGADLEVTFTSVPASGLKIHFGFLDQTIYFTCSAVDPLDSVRKSFVVPVTVLDAGSGTHIRCQVRMQEMWSATDAGLGVANSDWFTHRPRWRKEAERIVDLLAASDYDPARELWFAMGNEVWNTAPNFHQGWQYNNGVAGYYGQNGAQGLGICLGFLRREIEAELASRSLSYNIKWMAESWAADAPTTTQRFLGHAYFWENIAGLTAQDALAKNADLIPAIAMYVGGGFRNNSNNLPQITDSDNDPVTTEARDYVLNLLAQGGQVLEDAYINDWFLRASPVSVSTREWNMQKVRVHHANAVANGGNGDLAFYEGWTHEDAAGGWIPGLTDDQGFIDWFLERITGSMGVRVWEEMADAILAEFPNATLSHYTGPRAATTNNPWGVGPWENADTAVFAAIRDQYGPKADIF